MPITVQHQKEALSQAYVRAVIAKAGFNFGKTEFDYGIDGTIKDVINRNGRYVESCFGINFQLKSSCNVTIENGLVVYDLESKNYNDLVAESSMLPNILILLALPSNSDEWLEVISVALIESMIVIFVLNKAKNIFSKQDQRKNRPSGGKCDA